MSGSAGHPLFHYITIVIKLLRQPLGIYGKMHHEYCTLAYLGPYIDTAAQLRHNAFYNIKSKAGALFFVILSHIKPPKD